jgi:hypothetical protein
VNRAAGKAAVHCPGQFYEAPVSGERKHREQVEENRRDLAREERERVTPDERAASLAAEALELPEEPYPETQEGPPLIEFVCRFWGTEENLRAMREWMSDHDIAYEKIEDYEHLKYA